MFGEPITSLGVIRSDIGTDLHGGSSSHHWDIAEIIEEMTDGI
jgi:hypothetical protein